MAFGSLPPITIPTLYRDLDASLDALRSDPAPVVNSRAVVDAALAHGEQHYGINTGFGVLAQRRIAPDQVEQLQRNLLLSHAVGTGDLIPKPICRLMLQLKLHALGQGYSGVSLETFQQLLAWEAADRIPAIPSRGSVGASGDLAPLAHMSLPLLGLGDFWNADGTETLSAHAVLEEEGWEPLTLKAKDGLALINGTQQMAAYASFVLHHALRLLKLADVVAAMSLEALQGSLTPFDARLHELRPHPGQQTVAANVRLLLRDSEILQSHRHCGKVQDPYSLRCVPQVHGASRDALAYATSVVEREINSVTDNPIVFPEGDILSGGNFHGQPLALAIDHAKIALAEMANISERRTYLLLAGHDGLPELLMEDTGINSGFMIPQYTAAALVSENKTLCHPASVDSIPTSRGQEDHVSMGSIGALHLLEVFRNVEHVVAIELLTAAQALDFREPLRPGRGVEAAHQHVRTAIPHRSEDHLFSEDLAQCQAFVQSEDLLQAVEKVVPESII